MGSEHSPPLQPDLDDLPEHRQHDFGADLLPLATPIPKNANIETPPSATTSAPSNGQSNNSDEDVDINNDSEEDDDDHMAISSDSEMDEETEALIALELRTTAMERSPAASPAMSNARTIPSPVHAMTMPDLEQLQQHPAHSDCGVSPRVMLMRHVSSLDDTTRDGDDRPPPTLRGPPIAGLVVQEGDRVVTPTQITFKSDDTLQLAEIDAMTPKIIALRQQVADQVFAREQISIMESASERAAHEAAMHYHTVNRRLSTLTESAETALRVRLEAERDRNTSFVHKEQHLAAIFRGLCSAAQARTAAAEAAERSTRDAEHAIKLALPAKRDELTAAEHALAGLEAAVRAELVRGATLRAQIDERDALERKVREESERRSLSSAARAWFLDSSMVSSAIRPASVANAQAVTDDDDDAEVEQGPEAPTNDAAEGSTGRRPRRPARAKMQLDVHAFANAKLMGAAGLGVDMVNGFDHASNAYALDLSANRIRDLNFLATASKLKILNLSNNRITDTSMLEDLAGLMWLDLSYNRQITSLNLPAQFFFLVVLDISHCSLNRMPDLQLPVLCTLDISGNQLTELRIPSWLPLLQTLRANQNGIQVIWPLETCPVLETLELHNNRIHASHELLSLVTCPRLRNVVLTKNEVLTRPDLWCTKMMLPWITLLPENNVIPDNRYDRDTIVFKMFLKAISERYYEPKDPVRPGDSEILDRVVDDAVQLAAKMGDVHRYFFEVMAMLSPGDSAAPSVNNSHGGGSITTAKPTVAQQANLSAALGPGRMSGSAEELTPEDTAALRESQAYAQLTTLCRLCLDGNLPDCAHIAFDRARSLLVARFAPIHFPRFQAQCKGYIVRRRVATQILAIVLIQRSWREYLDRKRLAAFQRLENAATQVQRVWRGFRVRRIMAFITGKKDVRPNLVVPEVPDPALADLGSGDSELEDLSALGPFEPTSDMDDLLNDDLKNRLDAALAGQLGSNDGEGDFDGGQAGLAPLAPLEDDFSSFGYPADGPRHRAEFAMPEDDAPTPGKKVRMTSEMARRHSGRRLAGLSYGMGEQFADLINGSAHTSGLDVIASRKKPSETVNLLRGQKRHLEVFAEQVKRGDGPLLSHQIPQHHGPPAAPAAWGSHAAGKTHGRKSTTSPTKPGPPQHLEPTKKKKVEAKQKAKRADTLFKPIPGMPDSTRRQKKNAVVQKQQQQSIMEEDVHSDQEEDDEDEMSELPPLPASRRESEAVEMDIMSEPMYDEDDDGDDEQVDNGASSETDDGGADGDDEDAFDDASSQGSEHDDQGDQGDQEDASDHDANTGDEEGAVGETVIGADAQLLALTETPDDSPLRWIRALRRSSVKARRASFLSKVTKPFMRQESLTDIQAARAAVIRAEQARLEEELLMRAGQQGVDLDTADADHGFSPLDGGGEAASPADQQQQHLPSSSQLVSKPPPRPRRPDKFEWSITETIPVAVSPTDKQLAAKARGMAPYRADSGLGRSSSDALDDSDRLHELDALYMRPEMLWLRSHADAMSASQLWKRNKHHGKSQSKPIPGPPVQLPPVPPPGNTVAAANYRSAKDLQLDRELMVHLIKHGVPVRIAPPAISAGRSSGK
ncbi:hypothetical protein BC828DRAFT_383242 [Blastocladiella britannica]|nr:hypothetical protein BC828DRAFT_383242 [Blastocladiella britannica]